MLPGGGYEDIVRLCSDAREELFRVITAGKRVRRSYRYVVPTSDVDASRSVRNNQDLVSSSDGK